MLVRLSASECDHSTSSAMSSSPMTSQPKPIQLNGVHPIPARLTVGQAGTPAADAHGVRSHFRSMIGSLRCEGGWPFRTCARIEAARRSLDTSGPKAHGTTIDIATAPQTRPRPPNQVATTALLSAGYGGPYAA